MATDEVREARGGSAARLAAEIAGAERQERERLAEALHDDALQRLLVARRDLAEGSDDPAVLRAVRVQLDELTGSLRTLTAAMQEQALAVRPLGLALERMAEDAARRGRLVVHTHVAPAAAGDHDPLVLEVVRELLTNVVEHARASRVEVAITARDDAVVVRVADDGGGVDLGAVVAAGHSGHTGHARLRGRVAALGGALQLDASPEAGTTVTCVLPLEHLPTRRTLEDITPSERAGERSRSEPELGTVIAATGRLRGLLGTAQAVTDAAGLDALLREIARTISEDLGWVVVVNLYRPAWDDFIVAAGHGVAPEGRQVLDGASSEWTAWTPLLDDRYGRRGAYLVPAGEPAGQPDVGGSWAPPIRRLDGSDAWRAGDDLLIPLRHAEGHFLGILSLDAPRSGRRPSDAELDVLVELGAHAALAVQHAQDAIESTRHAAALDRLLHLSSHLVGTRETTPMLDVVTTAVADALGFGRVLVEVVGRDGLLVPHARHDAVPPAAATELRPLAPEALAGLLDPGFAIEGCLVLGREEAAAHLPEARRGLLASRANGRGWRAWDDHVIAVPMHGPAGRLIGVLWVGDPADRLVPGVERLRVLRAFADRAATAIRAAERREPAPGATPLAQLGDRRTFLRELDREVARTTRIGGSSVIVLAEVSGGPAGGGAELTELAEAFEAELRRYDRAFWIGGSLFGMVLAGGDEPPETTAITLRIVARMRMIGARRGLRVHFGTAWVGPRTERPDAVLQRAADSLLVARG